jgi:hypothetical protein
MPNDAAAVPSLLLKDVTLGNWRSDMPNDSAAVRSLLKDVTLERVVVIDRSKLLWLLGWGQARAGAWEDLLQLWEEIGQDRSKLRGGQFGANKIILTDDPTAYINDVKEWAK